eukprot:scaffold64_cov338-Pavlova_lutheri.AAC.1
MAPPCRGDLHRVHVLLARRFRAVGSSDALHAPPYQPWGLVFMPMLPTRVSCLPLAFVQKGAIAKIPFLFLLTRPSVDRIVFLGGVWVRDIDPDLLPFNAWDCPSKLTRTRTTKHKVPSGTAWVPKVPIAVLFSSQVGPRVRRRGKHPQLSLYRSPSDLPLEHIHPVEEVPPCPMCFLLHPSMCCTRVAPSPRSLLRLTTTPGRGRERIHPLPIARASTWMRVSESIVESCPWHVPFASFSLLVVLRCGWHVGAGTRVSLELLFSLRQQNEPCAVVRDRRWVEEWFTHDLAPFLLPGKRLSLRQARDHAHEMAPWFAGFNSNTSEPGGPG